MQTEGERKRDKRIRVQEIVVTVICLALIVFVFTWLITVAVSGRKHGLAANADISSSQSDNSSAELEDGLSSDINEEESSQSEDSQTTDESEAPYAGAADDDDFSDACFIGDSRTVGLGMNCDKPDADFYASQGLSINKALTDEIVTLDDGSTGTVIDGVSQKDYKRIFIMFGINEIGWPYPDNFVDYYIELVEEIEQAAPNATIYIQSVLPVSDTAVETNEVFTNENVDAFNEYVKQAADETDTVYLDINQYFKDEDGSLPEDAATDGIHFTRDYYLLWIDILAYLAPS
ncbi:MAG: GDSL-type esterase/lipase family protein [Ruminococcus sp.]|nr:GDSL-type esterase/lipase family protein [Ruminococcus sp.]